MLPAFWVIIAVEMRQPDLQNWQYNTPEAMTEFGEPDLFLIMRNNPDGPYDVWARHELERRRMRDLQGIMLTLTQATNNVHEGVIALCQSTVEVVKLTDKLIAATNGVHTEVQALASSSDRLEGLTKKLKAFTICLIVFAGIQIAVAAIQTWKMFQPEPERPIRVVVQPSQTPAPQTPPVPAQ
jgi:hypothetical protein